MRSPLAVSSRWVAVPLFGYDPRFASRFTATAGGGQDEKSAAGNIVAEVTWPIGDPGPIVRVIGGVAGPRWQQFEKLGDNCSCGDVPCEHRLLTQMAFDRGLQDNSALAVLPYKVDPELSIPGHQIRFRVSAAVSRECAPPTVIVMGGHTGWSLIVGAVGDTASVVASPMTCSCGQPRCLHRLFLTWAGRAYPDLISGLKPRPRAMLTAA